mmetsp:Transcript_3640/g.9787  ORF Transcript_3640/g.9787 Transcript_3640/m.9787 type:complete len:179 (-) Transcript_3640:55-591(-)
MHEQKQGSLRQRPMPWYFPACGLNGVLMVMLALALTVPVHGATQAQDRVGYRNYWDQLQTHERDAMITGDTMKPGQKNLRQLTELSRNLEDQMQGGDDSWYHRFNNDDASDDDYHIFDDDNWHQKEVATKTNVFGMFGTAPAQWTSLQWGIFGVFLTVSSLLICCSLRCVIRMVCPCL